MFPGARPESRTHELLKIWNLVFLPFMITCRLMGLSILITVMHISSWGNSTSGFGKRFCPFVNEENEQMACNCCMVSIYGVVLYLKEKKCMLAQNEDNGLQNLKQTYLGWMYFYAKLLYFALDDLSQAILYVLMVLLKGIWIFNFF